ncbi:MAG: hypothetical protein ACRD50_05215 [Candidatus Acidiferrales bacterium]
MSLDNRLRIQGALLFILVLSVIPLIAAHGQNKPTPKPETQERVDPRILQIKKVCVGSFGDDAIATQVKEIVIAKLFESKLYSLTEDCKSADFEIRGSVVEQEHQQSRSESEGVQFGEHRSSSTNGVGGGSISREVNGGSHEELSSSETKQHAAVTMRIVDKKTGDIIWATSQESGEGKTKAAFGEAAERAVNRLLRDVERADKQSPANH